MTIYKAYLKDLTGAIVARFHGGGRGKTGGGLQRIHYRNVLHRIGAYTILIAGDDERIPLFNLDYQIEILRLDQTWQADWAVDFEGFHRNKKTVQSEEGNELFFTSGDHYDILAASETIHWPAGSTQGCKNDPAETAAKEFVNENIGPLAGLDENGLSRVRQGLSLQADAASGATWRGCRKDKNLYDILVELSLFGPGDFRIVGVGDVLFEFQWKNDRWGEDKTRGNGVLPPVVFSGSQVGANATNIEFANIHANDANVVYVLGWGEGSARVVIARNTLAATSTPWSRRAVARDARDASELTELTDRGDATLDKKRSRKTLAFTALQTAASRYGRDYGLGDLTTYEESDGTEHDMKIVAVDVDQTEDGKETIILFLEEE